MEDTHSRWLYIASAMMGIAILFFSQPSISHLLTSHLPVLHQIVGSNMHTYMIGLGLLSIGFIGLVKRIAKKSQWQQEDNVISLFQRKRGGKLTIENGELKTMGFSKRLLYSAIPSYRKKHNRHLKAAINAITTKIKLNEHSTEIEKCFVKKLFLEKLAPLSRKIYKRKIDQSVLDYLSSQIATETNLIPGATEDFQNKFAAAMLWARLGNFKRPQGGVGGSYAIKDEISKQFLGIYKPYDEDTLGKNNPFFAQKIKFAFAKTIMRPFSQLAFDTVGGKAFIAEAAATKVSQFVETACHKYYQSKNQTPPHDIIFVPETHIVKMPLALTSPRAGSFQLWVNERHQTASQFLNLSRHYGFNSLDKGETSTKLSGELFDVMVILDYVTGNFDRHGDNWFILDNASGIRLIDGGWAMAPEHPNRWNLAELRNQYLWKKLPLADAQFTDLGRFIINEIAANQTELAESISALYKGQLINGDTRVTRMKERIIVLQQIKDSVTKKALADIRTAGTIHAYIS